MSGDRTGAMAHDTDGGEAPAKEAGDASVDIGEGHDVAEAQPLQPRNIGSHLQIADPAIAAQPGAGRHPRYLGAHRDLDGTVGELQPEGIERPRRAVQDRYLREV